jgi:hypothetical protein
MNSNVPMPFLEFYLCHHLGARLGQHLHLVWVGCDHISTFLFPSFNGITGFLDFLCSFKVPFILQNYIWGEVNCKYMLMKTMGPGG